MAGRKRKSTEPNDGAGTSAQANGSSEGAELPPPQPNQNRRQDMAEIARRRAAHFATWDVGMGVDSQDQDNIHTGGASARGLGPWSSAIQLANAREQEKEERENRILEKSRGENETQRSIWSPSRDPQTGRRPDNSVPLLSQLALRLVVDLLEDVETLWGLPDLVKHQIAAQACKRRALQNPETLRLFVEHSPAEICLPDCSYLDPEVLQPALLEAATPKLEKLQLGLVGRGLTDAVASAVAAGGVLSSLQSLCLSGAYRLSDAGLLELLQKMPELEELSIPQCSRIQGSALEQLPRLNAKLKRLDIAECRGLSANTITETVKQLPNVRALILDGIPEVDDSMLSTLSTVLAPDFEELSLAACAGITSEGLMVLINKLPNLRRLNVQDCVKIDTAAVVAIVEKCKKLEDVSLARCSLLDDQAVLQLAKLESLHKLDLAVVSKLTTDAVVALARGACAPTLTEINLSWCRDVSPSALGLLADSCHSLRRMVLWGCSHVNDSNFLLAHSNDALTVVGRQQGLN